LELKTFDREKLPLGNVLYLPASKKFYVQWDNGAANTRHYYGPFDGEPGAKLGLEASRFEVSQFRRNEAFRLRNAKAADVAAAVNELVVKELAEQGTPAELTTIKQNLVVVVEPIGNTVLISAAPQYMDAVLRVVSRLDVRPPQAPAASDKGGAKVDPASSGKPPAGPEGRKILRFQPKSRPTVLAYSQTERCCPSAARGASSPFGC